VIFPLTRHGQRALKARSDLSGYSGSGVEFKKPEDLEENGDHPTDWRTDGVLIGSTGAVLRLSSDKCVAQAALCRICAGCQEVLEKLIPKVQCAGQCRSGEGREVLSKPVRDVVPQL